MKMKSKCLEHYRINFLTLFDSLMIDGCINYQLDNE